MVQGTPLAGLRVLVVEDEMLISLMIEDVLIEEHCVVLGPYSRVAEALPVAGADEIDVAVMDVNIAGDKVFPVAEVLAKRGIPFLLLSGYGKSAIPPDRPHWRLCSKPFKPEDLITELKDLLDPAHRFA